MEGKKICVVSPSLKIGGIERALSVLSNYFVSKGYDVTFISCLAGDKFYTLNENIKFIEPHFNRTASKLNKLSYYPRMVLWIRKQVKRVDPDVVLTFGDNFNPLVLLAVSGLKYPVFISDRTSPDFKFHPLINKGKQILYPKSAGFIAQSTRAAEYKKKHFGDKLNIKIIPNAIKDVKLYDVDRKKQIVYVGRLSIEKGPDRLLEAFGKLKQSRDWKLFFAGSGPMMEELKQKAKDIGVYENVTFLGQVKEVDKLLAESSIFVLPSRLEGFPNALCEAMAAGLPSICFDCIPSGDVITNGEDGFIVPDGDTDALAHTMHRLIEDEELRKNISAKALQIRERLSPEKTGKMFLDFMFNNKI
jgi:GalNAc-alpha-(1->4)-GalNAc-alpha-(1->3)-diNAcBac-PP-undecaprenol alpha-1,4-N-acetyl-D-galactosaminyltransferase